MTSYHGERLLEEWGNLLSALKSGGKVAIQGDSLNISSLVAVAR